MKTNLIILILTCAFLLNGCEKKQEDFSKQKSVVEVGFILLKKQPVILTQEMSGRVRAVLSSEVRPQVSGIIKEQYYKEGSYVHKGDILYKIDPVTYQATYNEAVALLKSAQADIASIELKHDRYKELLKANGISRQEFDDVKAEYYKALALVEQRKAQLENAQINLDRTDIKASIDGHIGISSVTRGALVTANQVEPLTIIRYTDRVYVDLSQSSSQLLRLRNLLSDENIKQGSAEVELMLVDNRKYNKTGILHLQEVSVDESTGSVKLRAEFPNENGVLLPGMYVKAIIEGAINQNAFLIPQQAVERDSKANPIVTIVKDDNATERKIIEVHGALDNKWIVTSGISEGDKIIIEGLNRMGKNKVYAVDVSDKYIKDK